MDDRQMEQLFDITSERIAEIDEAASRGELPGEPTGPVVMGRPKKFGVTLKTVSFKETPDRVAAIDQRAMQLGMRRSDYLRFLIDRDFATLG